MDTSLRYGGDSKVIKIHAKQKFPIDSKTHMQVHGELDTRIGEPNHCRAVFRHFYPDFSASLGVGIIYNKHDADQKKYKRESDQKRNKHSAELRRNKYDQFWYWYRVQGKKRFAVTNDGSLSFNIKGRYDVDKDFIEKKPMGAAEFCWDILNFQTGQDLRLKLGYEVFQKLPYVQIRENNWTFNADSNFRWNVRYDL